MARGCDRCLLLREELRWIFQAMVTWCEGSANLCGERFGRGLCQMGLDRFNQFAHIIVQLGDLIINL